MSQQNTGARLQSEKKITLNADRATWLLDEIETYPHDRSLVAADVANLASQMIKGTFLPEQVTLIVCEFDGKTYRMNGQHTSSAVRLCAEEDRPVSYKGVRLQTYEADTFEDMRALYARLDRGRTRTNAAVVKSLLGGIEGIGDYSPKITRLLTDGLALWRHENPSRRRQYSGESAALDVLGDYRQLAEQVAALMGTFNPKKDHHVFMFRAPVVAAMYATFEKDSTAAYEFWDSVARVVGFDSEHAPGLRLNKLLVNTVISGGSGYRGTRNNVTPEELYRSCLHAWNKWRTGEVIGTSMQPAKYKSRFELK